MSLRVIAIAVFIISSVQSGKISGTAFRQDDKGITRCSLESYFAGLVFKEEDLLQDCSSILFDVGANAGTHVRKLFEPALYPKARVLSYYDQAFGSADFRSKPSKETGLCAYGFEANPKFAPKLRDIEKSYAKMGWRVKFLTPTVVDVVSDKKVNFHVASDPKHNDWASRVNKTGQQDGLTLKTLDFPSFLESAIAKRNAKGPRSVLVKMDIEGSEFTVMPSMLQRKLLCKGTIDTFLIEWHERFMSTDADKQMARNVRKETQKGIPCDSGANTNVVAFDDESYLLDGKPLPNTNAAEQSEKYIRSRHLRSTPRSF